MNNLLKNSMLLEDEKLMREAIVEAEKALETKNWPVGCVVTIDGEIVSRGYNQVYSKNNKILHAEIVAIQKIANLLADKGHKATMYVTYQPCPMCLGAILLNHIGRVVYGPDPDESGGLRLTNYLSKRFDHPKYKFQQTTGILMKECEDIFLQGMPVQKLKISKSFQ
jgi:tRNA(adenine34) deaminase